MNLHHAAAAALRLRLMACSWSHRGTVRGTTYCSLWSGSGSTQSLILALAAMHNTQLAISPPPQTPRYASAKSNRPDEVQSLSLPGPSRLPSSSSSSCIASSPANNSNSAFCNALLNSTCLGSTRSIGFSLALFRILFPFDQHTLIPLYTQSMHGELKDTKTHRGSHPASTRISTTALPSSHSLCSNPFVYRTATCKHVSPSLFSLPSISTIS